MPTTYDYTGSQETHDVTIVETVRVELHGAGGEDGKDNNLYDGDVGGTGGYIEFEADVSNATELNLWVGGGNGSTWGRSDGGSGGSSEGSGGRGGNGAGSTEIFLDGSFLAAADGGGGGGGGTSFSTTDKAGGGGGGARGGLGGEGATVAASSPDPGEDAEGSGFGGDGGDGGHGDQYDPNSTPGEDGGTEAGSPATTIITETQGGGNTGNGQIVIENLSISIDAPEGVTILDEREHELDLEWESVAGADEYEIYRHTGTDPYNNGAIVSTTSSTSHTDTGLTNGRQYHYQIVAVASAGESGPSSEAQASTLLPSPSIDDTDPYDDRVELSYSLADDNPDGHVDVLRSTDGSLGSEVATDSDLAQTSVSDTTVTEGVEYHYTLRRDTGDVTAYSSQVQETATFRPIDDPQIDSVADQSIDLVWDAGASAWSGDLEVWRARDSYDYADPKGEQIATLGASARSYTDPELHPNTEYTYALVAVADNEPNKTSDPATATTTGPDLPKTRTRRSDWTVEIRLDDRTLTPPTVGEPDVRPRANDLPEIRIPTTDGPWTRLDLTDGAEDLFVWYQGIRQPIEDLERVEEADDGHVLVGRGGTSLLDRVQIEVDQQPNHDLARDVIEEHTPYTAVVDAPPQDRSEETVFDVISASAWANLFANTDLSQVPVGIDDSTGELYNQQICWTVEGEDADAVTGGTAASSSEYSGGSAVLFDSTAGEDQIREYEFTTEHTIPAGEFGYRVRIESLPNDTSPHGLTFSLQREGDSSFTTLRDDFNPLGGTDLTWDAPGGNDPGEIPPGTHTFRIERTQINSADVAVDVVAPYDQRYESDLTFDNSVGSNQELDGPQFFGTPRVETDPEALVLSAVGASVTSSWNDTGDGQAMQVSNDGGATWLPDDGSQANSDSVSADFSDPGAALQVRFTLGRYGDREETPATGYQPQRIDAVELVATLDDTPLAVNQQWDTSARGVLRDLAEQAGAIWDVEWNDGIEINWTFPGVREATVEEPLTTYDQATDVRERASSVVVVGSNAQQVGDRVEAEHDVAQDLQQANLVSGSEAVYDPETGDSYQRDDDYELNYGEGTITTLQAGDVGSGQTVAVDYDYETRGRFETDSTTSDREITRNITGLVSDRQCAIAARRIALELSEPLHEAEVGFTPGPKSWSIVDQLTVNALPFEGPYTPRETRTQDGTLRGRFGSRQSVEEIVSEIKDQSDRVARRE